MSSATKQYRPSSRTTRSKSTSKTKRLGDYDIGNTVRALYTSENGVEYYVDLQDKVCDKYSLAALVETFEHLVPAKEPGKFVVSGGYQKITRALNASWWARAAIWSHVWPEDPPIKIQMRKDICEVYRDNRVRTCCSTTTRQDSMEWLERSGHFAIWGDIMGAAFFRARVMNGRINRKRIKYVENMYGNFLDKHELLLKFVLHGIGPTAYARGYALRNCNGERLELADVRIPMKGFPEDKSPYMETFFYGNCNKNKPHLLIHCPKNIKEIDFQVLSGAFYATQPKCNHCGRPVNHRFRRECVCESS